MIPWKYSGEIVGINLKYSCAVDDDVFEDMVTNYEIIDRVRVKQPLCRPVTSRSLMVGTGGLRSGAIAFPKTDRLVPGLPLTSVSSTMVGVRIVELSDRSGVTR